MSTFGQRVREARLAAGLTQAQLAKKAGFAAQSSIGNMENGKRDGSSSVVTLSAVLNVDPKWLQNGDGPIRFTLKGAALKIAQGFASLPLERQIELGPIIAATVGVALSDDDFVEKFAPKLNRK
jgi:transcriptional regulator with XRE-family HTH domain